MRGLDILGLASKKWNVKETLEALSKGMAVGLFADDTFGPNAIPNVNRLLATEKLAAIRAHLNWKGPNPSHALPPLDKIKALAPKWEKIAKQNLLTRVYVSPTCEYDSTDKRAIKAMLDLTKKLCPSCIIVQTPSKKGAVVPGYMVERHGKVSMKAGQIASYDGGVKGEGLFDIDAASWVKGNANAEIAFAWSPLCNMAEAHNKLPPNQRTQSPSSHHLTSLLRLFVPIPSAPTPLFTATPLKRPFLYKSHAEDSQGPDPRNNRPLLILKPKAAFVTLVTFQGVPVGKFTYVDRVGPFPPDLSRFYSANPRGIGLYGWEIADMAMSKSGSPFVWISHKGKFIGPIHPAHRTPFFQA